MIDRHETRILVVLHLWLLIIKRLRSVQIFISKQNFTVNCPHKKSTNHLFHINVFNIIVYLYCVMYF